VVASSVAGARSAAGTDPSVSALRRESGVTGCARLVRFYRRCSPAGSTTRPPDRHRRIPSHSAASRGARTTRPPAFGRPPPHNATWCATTWSTSPYPSALRFTRCSHHLPTCFRETGAVTTLPGESPVSRRERRGDYARCSSERGRRGHRGSSLLPKTLMRRALVAEHPRQDLPTPSRGYVRIVGDVTRLSAVDAHARQAATSA
jgi:hypothetical protein